MMFEEKHYGKRISEKLKDTLKRNINKWDMGDVAEAEGVSMSLVRDVAYRVIPLSERSAPAIIQLARRAFINATQKRIAAINDKDYLIDELKESEEQIRDMAVETNHQ